VVFRKLFSRQSLSSPAPYDVLAEGVVVGRIFKPNAETFRPTDLVERIRRLVDTTPSANSYFR